MGISAPRQCPCPFHCLIPPYKTLSVLYCPQRGHGLRTPVLVLSPGNYPQDNFLPPKGAGFPEHGACTIPTVSALPDFVRPLNLQLSVSQLRRLTLTIVLSPGFLTCPVKNPAPKGGRASLNIVLALRGARCNYPLTTIH